MGRIRPTKGMMLAVNAAIDGDKKEVDRFINEYELACGELDERLSLRNGRKYEFKRRRESRPSPKRQPKKKVPPGRSSVKSNSVDLHVTIDGRTSVAKLFKLIDLAERVKAAAQRELKRRPSSQIEPVKKALGEIELLRRKQAKLAEQIEEAEEALG